ncbi:TPA: NAD(P)-dependent oxidoreductase [Bacillus pseudomycoides]|nr:NAD(P)-dependent oxidoreductase [Bacillus pseudomycoides]
MKRVVVVGALTFVGYHLVQKFLKEEVEVYAFDFDNMNSMSKVNEEKLSLIGRNALFMYFSLRDREAWELLEECDIDALYFCLCEPNQQRDFRNERLILRYVKIVESLCKRKKIKCMMLSSVKVNDADNGDENGMFFRAIEGEIKKGEADYCILRVPAVYGPWQPSFMAYHHIILAQLKQQMISLPIEECTCDLLYVEDVANCLYTIGQRAMEMEKYTLCSEEKNRWQKGIEILQKRGRIQIQKKECLKGDEGKKIVVPSEFSLEKGMLRQISHIKQYRKLYETSNMW